MAEIIEVRFKYKRDFKSIKHVLKSCHHRGFIVDESLSHIKCQDCDEKLNPVWVICELARKENSYIMRLRELNKKAEKAIDKNRCKCEHCKKMTDITK